jgi:hypothetical protein
MGLLQKVKGWLNIGGVKVLLWKYSEPLKRSNPVITGAVLLKAKSPKTVLSVEVKFIEEFTHGKDDERKTDTKVLGSYKVPEHGAGLGYPLEMKPGEDREEPFTVHVTMTDRLQNRGGMLGAIGKLGAFAASEKLEYFLVATADVKGTPFDPTHKVKMTIAD